VEAYEMIEIARKALQAQALEQIAAEEKRLGLE
jgi:hypothetical protein